MIQHFWWIGAIFSVAYTIASVIWTIRVERKLRWAESEIRVLSFAARYAQRDISQLEAYASRCPTLRRIQ